ncbi:putative WD repeat-containing protein [Neolecta irregularis DAH-3]|uniref:Putative WD repeat-containing protein n=1 Tax=Neolecta irregularis (strain DAH-3) TaxID=1198029 RepID=A0A1U7LQN0_NEOID|nr:putative WD repeat-containing protein [Neolecta irregularis DAH-3]|eukprot:OLL24980.1 putative WD repeat-containing protein [Neolecta irregularis DAH-3]
MRSVSIFANQPTTHRGQPVHLSVDPKQEQLAYASNRSIFLRNIDNPAFSKQYTQHVAATTVAKFSPSGYYVASADDNGIVRIWDATREESILKNEIKVISGRVNDLSWDEDSKRVIAIGLFLIARLGHAFLFDSGNSVGEIQGHSAVINAVSIRRQRPFRAATVSDDRNIVFYHGVPYRYNTTISVHSNFVHDVRFSPDGETFITVGADAKVFLHNGNTGETITELRSAEGHRGSIFSVSWDPSSKFVATSSADHTTKLTWSFSATPSPTHQQVGNVFAGSQMISLSYDGTINYLDRSSAKPTRNISGHQKSITALGISQDSNTIFSGSYDGRICLWDTAFGSARASNAHTNQVIQVEGNETVVYSVAMDDTFRSMDYSSKSSSVSIQPLGDQPRGLAIAGGITIIITNSKIHILQSGKSVHDLATTFEPSSVAAHPLKAEFAVGATDNSIHVYTLNGTMPSEDLAFTIHRSAVTYISYSPTGTHLAAGESSGRITVYSLPDYKVHTSKWVYHTGRITGIAWNGSGSHAATSSLDTNIFVYSIERPSQNISIKNAHKGGATGVRWIDNTRIVTSGGDAIKIWEVTV